MQITIRDASPDDAADLSQLARAAKAHWGYPVSWIESWRNDLTITPGYLQAHHGFVVPQSGRPLGICVLEDRREYWSLGHLWVDPPAQRQGIGRALARHALVWAHGLRPGRVEIVSDPYAEPFYKRLGARQTGKILAPMPGAPERILPVLELQTAAVA